MRPFVAPIALVGIATVIASPTLASPPVKVSLQSSWNSSHMLVEVLETAALEEPESFFPLLDILTDPVAYEYPLVTDTNYGVHHSFLKAIKTRPYLSAPGALASFERALALHAAAPKIEAFHSYYAQNHDLNSFQEKHDAVHCPTWVDWYGQRICSPDELLEVMGYECPNWITWHGNRLCAVEEYAPIEGHQDSAPRAPPKLLSFDHVNPPPSDALELPQRTAILYAAMESPSFYSMHQILYRLSNKSPPAVQYVLRHVPPSSVIHTPPSYLSGYGVALHLKNMDYLALDDRQNGANLGTSQSPISDQERSSGSTVDPILSLLPELDVEGDTGATLSEAEVAGLGIKSSHLIISSPDPLTTLEHLSQNFPKYATSISRRLQRNPDIDLTLSSNSKLVQSGTNVMWLNGKLLQKEDLNPFAILRIMRKERATVQSLSSLGVTVSQAVELLTSSNKVQPAASAAVEGLFDASDRSEGGNLISWFNDLEKDERYARWSPSLHAMLSATHQLPMMRRNVFNIIIILDLSQRSSWNVIGTMASIVSRGFPMRIGLVPVVETEDGAKLARLFYYIMEHYGISQAVTTFTKGTDSQQATFDFAVLEAVFNELVNTDPPKGEEITTSFDKVVAGGYQDRLDKLPNYHSRLSTTSSASPHGHGFVNGRYYPMDDNFLPNAQNAVNQHLRYLIDELYARSIIDAPDLDMSVYFYDLPATSKRRNRYIIPTRGGLKVFSLPDLAVHDSIPETSRYIYPDGDAKTPLSISIIGDFRSATTITLFREALAAMGTSSSPFRLGFAHIPHLKSAEEPFAPAALYSLLRGDVLQKTSPRKLLKLLNLLHPVPTAQHSRDAANQLLRELLGTDVEKPISYSAEFRDSVKANLLLSKKIGLLPGDTAIIINGRVVGPIKEGEFVAADFEALVTYELDQRVDSIRETLENFDFGKKADRETYAHVVSMASSIISADQTVDPTQEGLFDKAAHPRSRPYTMLDSEHVSFELGNKQTALFHFGVILDPLSETAQTWSSLLKWIYETDLVHIVVYLNPATGLTEIPLKRFYRYNLQPRLTFDEENSEVIVKPVVEFRDLPVDPIYTLAMDVPQSWLARPHDSHHDLDNIHLAGLMGHERHTGVEALFSLDHLVVEGHARDMVSRSWARGLQLQLLASGNVPVADTLVVENLGYLQFKARPGVFKLDIRGGRSKEVYELESAGNEGWESPPVELSGADVSVTSFEGITIFPRFRRRAGMETADVLDISDNSGVFSGFVNKLGSFFTSKPTAVAKPQAEINIFTVASGLLYERFASIMILSVLKNTKSTVKFWFIENFLSPSFLEFIPHFAEAHGFEYELVTYKWPSWLRMPTEKQRIIWGYKILFLDVLFPMDLKKVIFVDADQIVRADLKELVDLDLQGAPYGYTPMGDDSEDMDGFRFWKTGYWKDHLKGVPYHISALYVIDLVRFRQMAAGDKLRGHYQALSADPNSLANLDQDLPNNLQRVVPIFSLGEDWLWCETWCSKERLGRAKTIDLCQNPRTKEPKLSRARQIPEWDVYDRQIATFAKELALTGKIRSTAAAEDVNALAGSPAITAKTPEQTIADGEGEDTINTDGVIEEGGSRDHDEL